ncbi:MAG TPA: hypothetical protein VFH47_05595 [Candidatus Thermoplasmatota archaeon]|nr:hypothetical protein [Candidatus Thermoplasmatota archaeon]
MHLARALGLCVLPLLLASALPGAAQPDEAQEQGAAPGPVHVGVGLHVLSVGNYDPNKGTYVLDFYLILAWDAAQAPEGFAPDRFEFMNGRATSKDLIFDGREGEARELWYRVQASLYAQPRFRDYPFDTQHIRLQMEDAVRPAAELVYVPMEGRVGLDERVNVAGWEVRSQAVDVVRSAYPSARSTRGCASTWRSSGRRWGSASAASCHPRPSWPSRASASSCTWARSPTA